MTRDQLYALMADAARNGDVRVARLLAGTILRYTTTGRPIPPALLAYHTEMLARIAIGHDAIKATHTGGRPKEVLKAGMAAAVVRVLGDEGADDLEAKMAAAEAFNISESTIARAIKS